MAVFFSSANTPQHDRIPMSAAHRTFISVGAHIMPPAEAQRCSARQFSDAPLCDTCASYAHALSGRTRSVDARARRAAARCVLSRGLLLRAAAGHLQPLPSPLFLSDCLVLQNLSCGRSTSVHRTTHGRAQGRVIGAQFRAWERLRFEAATRTHVGIGHGGRFTGY